MQPKTTKSILTENSVIFFNFALLFSVNDIIENLRKNTKYWQTKESYWELTPERRLWVTASYFRKATLCRY